MVFEESRRSAEIFQKFYFENERSFQNSAKRKKKFLKVHIFESVQFLRNPVKFDYVMCNIVCHKHKRNGSVFAVSADGKFGFYLACKVQILFFHEICSGTYLIGNLFYIICLDNDKLSNIIV
jgi:hypothetical protein